MKTMTRLVLVAFLLNAAAVARAGDENTIFVIAAKAGKRVSLSDVVNSPTYARNADHILAIAESELDSMVEAKAITLEQRAVIRGWFTDLPFNRVVDLEIIFPGFPDAIGLCLEGNPTSWLSVEACAGTVALIVSASVNVKSRMLHYVSITKTTGSSGKAKYKGWEFGMGPGIGRRQMAVWAIFDVVSATTTDGFLSAELVRWYSKYFGLSLQVDLGLMLVDEEDLNGKSISERTWPMGKMTLGLVF